MKDLFEGDKKLGVKKIGINATMRWIVIEGRVVERTYVVENKICVWLIWFRK